MRSWFYRIFLILAVLFICIFNFGALVSEESMGMWIFRAIPSNIPYLNLMFLNTGQAVIAVFLSSEFLKTDKKLDTSEVFYVHPLSNAEYVIGKIWGNIKVFFRLDLIIIAIVVTFNIVSGIQIDWLSYIIYFLLICIPTLVYIFGLSVGLMLILKNQAITFVLLLGYIALTLFYIGDKFYYLFDYMVYSLPLVKSTIVGFTNASALINHRLIYLFIGLGFVCISIFLFRRLPNDRYGRYRWLALSFCFIIAGLYSAYNHVSSILDNGKTRALYTEVNNKYVHSPKMIVNDYDITVEQQLKTISSEVEMKCVALENASVFTFCLNPALAVQEISENGIPLSHKRDNQIILIDFGREVAQGNAVTITVKYAGSIDESFCYLDIPDEILNEVYVSSALFRIDKKYSFQTDNYLLFTPETYWYPRPGTSYSSTNSDWQQDYFSNFRLTVKPLDGLKVLSQGTMKWPQSQYQVKVTSSSYASDQGGPGAFGPGRRASGGRRPEGGSGRPGGGQREMQAGQATGRSEGAPPNASVGGGERTEGRPEGEAGSRDTSNIRRGDMPDRRLERGTSASVGDGERAERRPDGEVGDPGGRSEGMRGGRPDMPPGDSTFMAARRGMNRVRLNSKDSLAIAQDSMQYIYETDFPTPAITLIIGDYEQKGIDVDGTHYNIWHLKGHDYFTAAFDSIIDTIPSQLRERRRFTETQYSLDYSFRRFSLVEVPVQFVSYVRTWTQAQEKMQPEMVLYPEKGSLFNEADIVKRVQNEKRWASRNGTEISDEEAAIRTLNNFTFSFLRTESDINFTQERGVTNITSKPNPYFIFPQLYNYRYNIFSSEWPIANRLIELYLQDKTDNNNWMRQMNGISNNEKANLLMERYAFKDLLADVEQRDLLDNVISLKINDLFALGERNVGYREYRDSLRAVLKRNIFKNVSFESLLDTMGRIAGEDFITPLQKWSSPMRLPVYIVSSPEVVRITNRDKEVYVVKFLVTNDSDNDGIINIEISTTGGNMSFGRGGGGGGGMRMAGFGGRGGSNEIYDPRAKRKVSLAAHETKQFVSVWDEAPRSIAINTLVSANLPNIINLPVNNIIREQNKVIDVEGDFIVSNALLNIPGEIIVDNEDPTLFSLSKPDIVGLLPQWLEGVGDNSFRYSGVTSWRPPLQWTLTTNDKYFGTHIRSAYVVKNGNGSQTATWKIPVPAAGSYDLYYYVVKPDDLRGGGGRPGPGGGQQGRGGPGNAEYRFKVVYDNEEEKAYINLRRSDEGWSLLGSYFFEKDTVRVVLSNDCEARTVTADAVKIVRK